MINFISGKRLQSIFDERGRLFFHRRRAHIIGKKIVKKRGKALVGRKEIKHLKTYCKNAFGTPAYWPWLAIYMEIQGDFKHGWMPDDYYRVVLLDRHNPIQARISSFKTFDYRLFPEISLEPLVLIIGGVFYDSALNKLRLGDAISLLKDHATEVVVKRDEGQGGSEVKFFHPEQLDLRQLLDANDYVIQPALVQHEDLKKLSQASVNTLRVLTYRNLEGDVSVKFSYLRFSATESRVDNTAQGGALCKIRRDGFLEAVAYDSLCFPVGDRHPLTGVNFGSVQIPNYASVLARCVEAHNRFPYLRIVGWDMAINHKGEPVLLEWNAETGLWRAEALFGPFFSAELERGEL